MMGLGFPELMVILAIALLVFGPKKLPELGGFLGKSLREFRSALEHRDEVEESGNTDTPRSTDEQEPKSPAESKPT